MMSDDPSGKRLGMIATTLLGAYHFVLPIFLALLVVELWSPVPSSELPGQVDQVVSAAGGAETDRAASAAEADAVYTLYGQIHVTAEQRFLLIALLMGGLGATIHAATSFGNFLGSRKLYASWAWWYILRAPIGMALGVVFYILLRAGMFSPGQPEAVNDLGVAGIAGLAGVSSKHAVTKLKDLAVTLFGDEKLQDELPVGAEGPPKKDP